MEASGRYKRTGLETRTLALLGLLVHSRGQESNLKSRLKNTSPLLPQDSKEMPPKTKGKGIKAATQKKKKNVGAGESGWMEVSASCFSMLWLGDRQRCSRENLALCMMR